MKIVLSTSEEKILATVHSWEYANIAAKAIFKRNYWSDLYYSIDFEDGTEIDGSIDLEPASFHQPHQKIIFTWHLETFWGNISKLSVPNPHRISATDITEFKRLLTYLN